MNIRNRIFVIGHPGAGKTLFAKTLAEKLGWQFVDADFGLEFHIGRILLDSLGKQGESAFHKCSAEILSALQQKENIVVATDASVVDAEVNQKILASEFLVYLQVSLPVQLQRLSPNAKPLLLEMPDVSNFLQTLHDQRDELYLRSANLVIDTDDNALEKHVTHVMKILGEKDSQLLTLDEKELIFFHKKQHAAIRLPQQQALCLKLLAQGNTAKEIARVMNISYRTIEGYIAKTMEQLGCASSKELIALYFDKP